MDVWHIGKHAIEIGKPDKILFPKSKITKGELIDYYAEIADIMLPHIKNRPISMHRFPHGIDKGGFFHKNAPDYFPSWIKRINVPKKSYFAKFSKSKEEGIVHYVLCNNAATLVYLANQYCITPHVWLSRVPKIELPNSMIFDLDPSRKNQFADVLEDLGLVPFVMTTGSRGVHVVVPIKPQKDFDTVRKFARGVAELLIAEQPTIFTTEIRKRKRHGRVFIDTLRNAFAQTCVAPYAVRAKEGAPVATPIEWKELARVTSQKYTIKNIFKRLARKGDVWEDINKHTKALKIVRKKLDALIS